MPVTSWRMQGDIEVLHLGDVPVGRVNPAAKAWIFNLNYPACFWKGERTVEQARLAAVMALNAWLTKAKLTQGDLFA